MKKIKSLLGALIIAYCEEREIDVETVASTTIRRTDLERGFETDESYYFELAEQMRAKEDINLNIDAPPELVVEVEIIRSAIAKLELFASMGVLEVWRHDGASLQMFRLKHGEYESICASRISSRLSNRTGSITSCRTT